MRNVGIVIADGFDHVYCFQRGDCAAARIVFYSGCEPKHWQLNDMSTVLLTHRWECGKRWDIKAWHRRILASYGRRRLEKP